MRSPAEFDRVLSLAAEHNRCEISRITGIPRSTVSGWLNGRAPRFGVDRTRGGTCLRCGGLRHPFPQLIGFQYAYLLGLYLGDGCLLRHPRGVYRLHVFLDSAYPIIAAECEAAMSLVMPASRASCLRHPRYNRSLDIQRIFCDTCDRLDIAWRQDGPWNISVARKEAVATMDRHVGPKR